MHKLNVQILGPSSFFSTLNELKKFLKFNPLIENSDVDVNIILFHTDVLQDNKKKDYIVNSDSIKICAGKRKDLFNNCDATIELPATLNEINAAVDNAAVKKKFNINSSIELKSYLLNKNEKKLSKLNDHILLTEKEVQLLELFLKSKKPISKDSILSSVWNYSSDADTHTVETHIYRLRKKIAEKFMDDQFILNDKNGYYL